LDNDDRRYTARSEILGSGAAMQMLSDPPAFQARARPQGGMASRDPGELRMARLERGHGFATLWLGGNLTEFLGTDPALASDQVARGLVAIANVTSRQIPQQQRRRQKGHDNRSR
jgi:hypothetical protein